ncbi:MAG: hypothetical protein IPG90_18050 [Bacteroidetes bacterium]|nr:hypothetical protein [Bacteroidota bacterium]
MRERRIKDGKVLRANVDMASPGITACEIRNVSVSNTPHHQTGHSYFIRCTITHTDKAIQSRTSLANLVLEFEVHRPLVANGLLRSWNFSESSVRIRAFEFELPCIEQNANCSAKKSCEWVGRSVCPH